MADNRMLGEIWIAFGVCADDKLIALPEYAAASKRAVGEKIMDQARREGYRGTLADHLQSLGWSIRRVGLVDDAVTGELEPPTNHPTTATALRKALRSAPSGNAMESGHASPVRRTLSPLWRAIMSAWADVATRAARMKARMVSS